MQYRILIGIGVSWGLIEVVMGSFLKKVCPSGVTGSVLAGFSFLFIAMAYAVGRNPFGCDRISQPIRTEVRLCEAKRTKVEALFVPLSLAVVLVIACAMKAASSFIIGLPVMHGAIANPIFAFVTEVVFFYVIVTLFERVRMGTVAKGAATGAIAATTAIAAFPLVGYVTGIPACIKAGTTMPLAFYYSYVAIGIAAAAVPVGGWMGAILQQKIRSKLCFTSS